MKAYVIEQPGGPEVLKLRDLAPPVPAPNEVKIRVRAFGLNRAETYLRAGKMGPITGPRVPGIEAVGEIVTDPSGTYRVGQRVATAMGGMQFDRPGSYAEEVTVLRGNVIDLDGTTLDWEELAALPEAYLTVWGSLTKSLAVARGQTLLVRGATSSVGLAAVAYGKALGVHVVATTRSLQNVARLREVGADEVIVDDGEIAERIRRSFPEGIDAVLEIVGASVVRDSIKASQAIRCCGDDRLAGWAAGAGAVQSGAGPARGGSPQLLPQPTARRSGVTARGYAAQMGGRENRRRSDQVVACSDFRLR